MSEPALDLRAHELARFLTTFHGRGWMVSEAVFLRKFGSDLPRIAGLACQRDLVQKVGPMYVLTASGEQMVHDLVAAFDAACACSSKLE